LRNFNVAVREVGEQILFLHRLQPGGADRSYGIEVGRLAGLPTPVLQRAREILTVLEGEHLAGKRDKAGRKATTPSPDQLGLFAAAPHPVVERLAAVDVNSLTPIAALTMLAALAEEAKRAH
jgi:DNA mismatch repair protein MutS